MGLRIPLLYALLAICPQFAVGSVIQEANFIGQWSRGRSLMTNYHVSCTLDVDSPIDFLSLTISNIYNFDIEIWDFVLIEEQFDDGVYRYQSMSTAYPPRYVVNFVLSRRFFGPILGLAPVTCQWDILSEPLIPVTTTTTPATTPESFVYPDEIGFNLKDSCGFLTENFAAELPEPMFPFVFPGRGPAPPTILFPSPRKRRGVGVTQYPEVNYTHALDLSLSFYELQRSGRFREPRNLLDGDSWMEASGFNHVTDDGRDLNGGWYNGNDAVKINLPMAYSVVTMGWSLYTWDYKYEQLGLSDKVKANLEWALDYLLKCWVPEENLLYVQVGDLETDRTIWERFDSATYDEMTRNFYHVTEDNPGSDVAAEMAAAFAIGSLIVTDIDFSTELYNASQSLYKFARRNRGISTAGNNTAEYPSYTSTDDKDDLCVAALWLYTFDYDESYLRQAIKYFKASAESTADRRLYSWDNKFVVCAIHLYYETYELEYQDYVIEYLQSWVNGPVTEQGYPDVGAQVPSQYIVNAALIGLMSLEYEVIEDTDFSNKIVEWSAQNINRLLGWNLDGQSYLIGYSDKYPQNPYHKNSACPNVPESCGWDFYNSVSPNTNTLEGALVGGPDNDGVYTDSRQNKLGNSVTLEYNAGLHVALIGLKSYKDTVTLDCAKQLGDELSQTTSTVTPEMTTQMRTRYTTLPPTPPPPMPITFNYSDALTKSILFYMAQRGGQVPDNYPITWLKNERYYYDDIGQNDRGGWFDDGGNVKTGVTMASAASLLSWGALKYRTGYEQSEQLPHLHGVLRVGLNYLMDTLIDDTTLIQKDRMEVNERSFWTRPSDEILAFNPPTTLYDGEYADIAAGVSAALVLGSEVFKDIDANYSATLLESSMQFYQLSQTMQGAYNDTDSMFYSNAEDATDEKCVAAAWLFRATGDSFYIAPLINSYTVVRQTELSWKNQHVLCQILLYETTGQSKYEDAILYFLRHWMDSGVQYTPQGLAWHDQEGPLRYSANAAFVALLAADLGITPSKSRTWAKSQIDYMLGKNSNAYSYLIGYGNRFPRRPHHRASSCPDNDVICDWSVYNSPRPNPLILIGALVSGPDLNDFHEDQRTNHVMNRVAVDYNAGFQSVLAALVLLFPQTTQAPPKPTTPFAPPPPPTTTTTTSKPITTYKQTTTTTTEPKTTLMKVTIKPTVKPTTTKKPVTQPKTTTRPPTTEKPTTAPPITTQGSANAVGPTTSDNVNSASTFIGSFMLICTCMLFTSTFF